MAGGLIKARQSSDAALEKNGTAHAPAWSSAQPPDEHASGIPWNRYFAALRRYKWLMLAVIVGGTALGVAATRFSKPVYEVQATIWISQAEPRYGRDERGPIRAEELVNPGAWIELFKSFAVLDSVVTKMSLYRSLEQPSDSAAFAEFELGDRFRPGSYSLTSDAAQGHYVLATKDGVEIERATIGDSVGRRAGFHWVPPRQLPGEDGTINFTIVNPRDISIALQSQVATVLPQGSNFLRVSLTGTDPPRMAAILNTWTDEFVSTAAELKKRNLVELAKVLEAQLLLAENGLKRAERALENLRVHTITLPSESGPVATAGLTPDPVRNAFLTYKTEYDNLRHDRQTLENLIAEVRQGTLPADALLSLPSVREGADNVTAAIDDLRARQAALRAARERYTDAHKVVRDLQQSVATLERQTIPQLATAFLDQFTRREQDLSARIETTSRELRAVPSRTMEELRLRRELTIAQDLHTTLQNRHEEARLAEASAVPDVSILDAAVAPQQPKTNRAPLIVFAAFLASVAAAIALALLLDKLDKRLRYPEQAARELGVDVIGAIPPLKARADVDPAAAAEETEAFRSVRLHLQQAFDTSPVLLTISSPGVGDGKSTVSSKLAKSFAKAGYRTLIIDGDTRRGSLHSVFRTPARPGLLDYLAGDASIKEILREASYENLSIIARGGKRERGPELLASEGMSHLIGTLEGQFDALIVDSPPLGAGIDPFALGTATGSMLLVLRPGETDRKVAEAKLRTLERFPVRLLGAVLNDVPLEGAYQQYSYVYGYTADEDGVAPQRTSDTRSIVRSAEAAPPPSP